jgi:hypothetical protein
MRSPEKKPDFHHHETINTPRPHVWDTILEKWDELREEDESLGELYEGLEMRKNLAGCSIAATLVAFNEMEKLTFNIDTARSKFPLPIPLQSAEISLELRDLPKQRTNIAFMGSVALGGRFMPSLLVNKSKETILSLAKPKIAEGLNELKYAAEASYDPQQGERAS